MICEAYVGGESMHKFFKLWDRELERGNGVKFRLTYQCVSNRLTNENKAGPEFYENMLEYMERVYGRLDEK